jgi:peroxiredoxin
MLAYQAGIAKFEGMEAQVFGVSTDNVPSLREFAMKVNASFPLLSDFATRQTAKNYGVLMEKNGVANRATFVIDTEGKIVHIEEGSGAIDPTGAEMACQRVKKK